MWDCEHIWEAKILIKAIGDAAHHFFTSHALDKFGVGVDDVGGAEEWIPVEVFLEGFLEGEVADVVATGVEVQQAVEAYALA